MAGTITPVPSSKELAMTNELILRVLAKHASPSDLQRYREVSSLWNLVMTPGYQQNATVTFKTIYKMLVYAIEMDPAPQHALLHRNFNILIPITTTQEGEADKKDPENFSPFFLKYSDQIHNLKLLLTLNANYQQNLGSWLGLLGNLGNLTSFQLDVDFYRLHPIHNFDLNQVPALLSLERLKFKISHRAGGGNPGPETTIHEILTIWREIILTMSPNLRSLSVKKIQFYKADYTRRFQALLMNSLAVVPSVVPNLEDFEMSAVAGTPKEPLKLNTIPRKLKLIWSPTESQGLLNWIDLNDLLARNSETLEELTISLRPELTLETTPPRIYIGLRFPLMPRLKGFHMQLLPQMEQDSRCQIKVPFASVDYATICPLLEELTLDVSSYREVMDAMFSLKLPVCQSMKKISGDLTILRGFEGRLKGRFPNAVIQKLGKQFDI